MRALVTGGAGFVGSHLCDALLDRGDEVVAVDNLSTGDRRNIDKASQNDRFSFVDADVVDGIPVEGPFDCVMHLASPASPADYLRLPLETLAASSKGAEAAAELALANGCRFVFASTSEVYGDALEHPQRERYWGNVNPVGPRSVYDEAKRFGEALTSAYARSRGLDSGIVRIFNTYGPRLRAGDGRVVPNFIVQALSGEPLTIYGDGSQTRSYCYVEDLVEGLIAMALSPGVRGPVNLGNPEEHSVLELAGIVKSLTASSSELEYLPLPEDDPKRRRPDISLAAELLGWKPTISIREGIARTAKWFEARS